MRTARTYYEILGLPQNANATQIKRRFKQLASKYHPDVAKDKETAHRLFIQIKEAYDELSDPARRSAYDARLNDQIDRSQYRAPGNTGQVAGGESVAKYLRDAQYAFIQKRFNEAATHCKRALGVDSHNARACAILGDVYRAQGKINSAMKYYSLAVQYNPSDRDSEKKLMNLIGKQAVSSQRARNVHEQKHEDSVPARKHSLINNIWWALVFFLIVLIGQFPGKPIPWLMTHIPQVSLWSWNFIGLIAGASMLSGILLSINGIVQHPDEELVFEWGVIPLGGFLLLGSSIFFLGSAGLYALLSLLQDTLSRSMMTVFACVIGIVLLSALMYDPDATRQVLLFGGNVAFIPMLVGWYIGAAFQPLEY